MENKNPPRVLLIAHNALSQTNNNGKTLSSFFSGWEKDCLAQLYITAEYPDTSICSRFYRITDQEILKAVLKRGSRPGGVLTDTEPTSSSAAAAPAKQGFLGKLIARRPQWLVTGRDICWGTGVWKTPELETWLDDFLPEAVFMQCSAPAIYDIAFWICDRYKIPYFLEITDDYTSSKFSLDPFFWLYLTRMRRQMGKAIRRAEKTLVIGEKMEKEYAKRFGGSYYIAMNAVEAGDYEPAVPRSSIQIVFTGNLGLGRWKTIEALGNVCNSDPELSERIQIDIYSGTQLSPEERERLDRGVMHFRGKVSAVEVADIQKKADVLLHVESFDPKDRYITRYSISTKISEYLARGRCLLAIGPGDVASIEYIRDYHLGIALTDLSEASIKACLLELLRNEAARLDYGRRAYERACMYHNIKNVQWDIAQMISGAVNRDFPQKGNTEK